MPIQLCEKIYLQTSSQCEKKKKIIYLKKISSNEFTLFAVCNSEKVVFTKFFKNILLFRLRKFYTVSLASLESCQFIFQAKQKNLKDDRCSFLTTMRQQNMSYILEKMKAFLNNFLKAQTHT